MTVQHLRRHPAATANATGQPDTQTSKARPKQHKQHTKTSHNKTQKIDTGSTSRTGLRSAARGGKARCVRARWGATHISAGTTPVRRTLGRCGGGTWPWKTLEEGCARLLVLLAWEDAPMPGALGAAVVAPPEAAACGAAVDPAADPATLAPALALAAPASAHCGNMRLRPKSVNLTSPLRVTM